MAAVSFCDARESSMDTVIVAAISGAQKAAECRLWLDH
jgi:hypothetical protein